MHYVLFAFCYICNLSHLNFVTFALCRICILSGLHFVCFWRFATFAFCQICILSRIPFILILWRISFRKISSKRIPRILSTRISSLSLSSTKKKSYRLLRRTVGLVLTKMADIIHQFDKRQNTSRHKPASNGPLPHVNYCQTCQVIIMTTTKASTLIHLESS